jgi:uncharacterized protein involved in type VI secretion and phage assembly
MTTRAFADSPVVATDRPLPAEWADLLDETRVEAAAGRPAAADLRFRDPYHQLLTRTGIGIGSPLRISAVTTADLSQVRIFTGEVTRVACEVDDDGTFTVVRAQDLGHRLTRGRRLTVWKRATLRDVVEQIAGHAGLKAGQVADGDAAYRHLVQPNITDWEFLQTLAELHGSTVTVQGDVLAMGTPAPARRAPDPGGGSDQSPYMLRYGDNLLALDTSVDALGPVRTVQVRGWNPDAKEPVTVRTDVTDSAGVAIDATVSRLAAAWGGDVVTELAGTGFALREHLPAAAASFADAAAADFARLEATASGSPYLAAGAAVTLAGVGSPFTGRYTVTGSLHQFGGSGYRTQVSVTTRQQEPGTAPAAPASYAMPGLAIGVVVDVKEPDDRQSGAVKVTFPWLDDAYTSDWARTVQWGGVGGGGVISPSEGDEVLVGFEQGRLDRPYVLGGLYNGKDKPPRNTVPLVSDAGKVNRRSLASRGGNRIELLDTDGSDGVLLSTGDGNVTIRFDRAKKTLTLTADSIVLTAGTGVTISAPKVDVKCAMPGGAA